MQIKWFYNVKLPLKAAHPLIWIVTAALPAALLILTNLHLFSTFESALSDEGKINALMLLLILIAHFLYCSLSGIIALILKRRVHPLAVLPAFTGAVAYLVFFILLTDSITPPWQYSWIISTDTIIYYQFALLVPVIFYSLVRFASFPLPLNAKHDAIVSIASLAVIPLCWYLLFQILILLKNTSSILSTLLIIYSVAATMVLILLLVRVLLFLLPKISNPSPVVRTIVSLFAGIILPVAGLILNRFIPFPADLQRPSVYVWTVANGLLLLVPEVKNAILNRILMYLRVASYPFVLYFFIVFLPFLPLSIPAMILFGGGFLILAPTVLFFLYSRRVVDDFSRHASLRNLAASAGAFISIPLLFTALAFADRITVHDAINYAYSPSYSAAAHFKGSTLFLRHALYHQDHLQKGNEIPFVSSFYNMIVFDNLVLSSSKRTHLERLFLGKKPNVSDDDGFMRQGNLFSRSTPPSESVKLPFEASFAAEITDVSYNVKTQGRFSAASITIKIKNTGDRQQEEFRTLITLPEYAVVTGYSLRIGGIDVPGRIFEKKTALFVYSSIMNTRRDPGILYHLSPDTLALRVFPVEKNSPRECTVHVMFPSDIGGNTDLSVGENTLHLASSTSAAVHKISGSSGKIVVIPPQARNFIEAAQREAVLYYVVDRSENGPDNFEELMHNNSNHFAQIKNSHVVYANYNITEALSGMKLVNVPEKMGGFDAERAIRYIVTQSRTLPLQRQSYPVIVLISSDNSEMLAASPEDDEYFSRLIPEGLQVYRLTQTQFIKLQSANKQYIPVVKSEDIPLTVSSAPGGGNETADSGVVKSGDAAQSWSVTIVPCGDNRAFALRSDAPAVVYEDLHPDFPCDTEIISYNAPDVYIEGMLSKEKYRSWLRSHDPSLRCDIFETSKLHNVLVPITAYIVVEDDVQWKVLTEKEKQKINANDALDHTDTPSPGLLLVFGFVACISLYESAKISVKRGSAKNSQQA